MLLVVLAACAAPEPDAEGPPAGGWSLGEAQACDAPVAAGWSLVDGEVEEYPRDLAEGLAVEPGAVGLVEADEPWLVWTPPNAPVRARRLADDAAREVDTRPASALAQGDLDGDGRVDLVLAGGTVEIVWAFGTDDEAHTELWPGGRLVHDAAVVDVDGDGRLDLVLGFTAPDHDDREAMRPGWIPNLGDRTFGEVLAVGGDAAAWGPVFDVSVADIDRDGVPDVYLCNDFGGTVAPNVLLRSDGGALAPTAPRGLDVAASCMGVSWGDLAGDGTLAAYVAASAQQFVLLEDASGWYDGGAARGLGFVSSSQMPWGSALDDLDNDGRVDLLVGMSDFYGPRMAPAPVILYHQDQDGRLSDEGPSYGLPTEANARGVLARDLDGDGVVELIVGDALRSPWIWASQGCTADAWLAVEAPAGSRVTVEAGGRTFAALVATEPGWGATGPARAHFGLGSITEIDAIEVAPPWGATERLEGPFAARRVARWIP